MKKVQLEVWGTLDKFCLISAITKYKTCFADQNWVAISRHTKQLYDTISKLAYFDKRNDDWFSAKQCAAHYEFIIKGTGTRKKKRIDKNTDYSDFHDTVMISCKQEFCDELELSLEHIKEEYLKSKKIVEDVDSDKLDDETLDELINEMVEKEKSSDIKSKLKSMLDEKNATECENSTKHLSQQTLIHSEPSTSGEQKTSITTSPLLTSLLQSPSPLVRPSSSTSSPTISLLLHSSPSVSLTDSTLSKLLEAPTPLPSTSSTTTSFDPHSYIFQTGSMDSPQSSTEAKKTNSARSEEVLMQREQKESDNYEKDEIFDDMSDIEQGVVESEVIIENESSPVKRLTPKRLDMEQVEDEQEEEEVLETVEEIIERVEEAIIETVGESSLNQLVLTQDIETVSISDDEIETIHMEDSAYEVIVVGSQEVTEPSDDAITDEPIIIEDDNTDADKIITDIEEAVLEKEVTDDSIPQQSFEDPSSEDVAEDESLTQSFTMQETKMNQDTEMLEISYSERINAEDSEVQVPQEENMLSRINAAESHKDSQKFDSDLDGCSLAPSEKESAAFLASKNEEIEQHSITKISKDHNDSLANSVDELSNDNFQDKIKTGKPGSDGSSNTPSPIHMVINVDETNEESSLEAIEKSDDKDLTRGNVQIVSTKNETKGIIEINDQNNTEIDNEPRCVEKNEAFETSMDSTNKMSPNIPAMVEEKEEETDHDEQIKCGNVDEKNYDSVSDNDNDSIKQGSIEQETTLKDKTKEQHINNDLKNKNEIVSKDTIKDLATGKSVVDKNNISDKEMITLNSGEGNLDNDLGIIGKQITLIQVEMTKESELTVGDQELTGDDKTASKEEATILTFEKQVDAEKTLESIPEKNCHVVELVPSVENVKINSDGLVGATVEVAVPEASNELSTTQTPEEKTKIDRQMPDTKNDYTLSEEHEETRESFERYSDVLVISDDDSDSKDKSDTTEETEDNSLISDDSKDGLDDSLKFSSLETISTHSDSPPDLYYTDPKFAVLRSKEMELKLLMQKGFEEIKTKAEELVPSSSENERYGKRKYFKESSKSSHREDIIEKSFSKLTKFQNIEQIREGIIEKNISKLKRLENLERNREKIKSKKPMKENTGKERIEKDKLRDNKLLKIGRKTNYLNSIESKPDSPSLSTTSSDEDRDYKSWKKSILLVYNRLASHKYASVFSKPITENEAPNYHQLILRPMDLSTIKRNIENGVIRTTVEFQRDMLLMVQNAIIYNKYDTPVYDMAKVMGDDMLAQMEVMVQALGDGVPLIGDTGDDKQITRARTSKSSSDAPLKKKRKNQDPDENRPKRSKLSASSS